jgi:hypothetical protein
MEVINYQATQFVNLTSRHDHECVLLDVLTQDRANMMAVYRVIADRSDEGYEDWFLDRCMSRGSKLPYETALTSFPNLVERDYRK